VAAGEGFKLAREHIRAPIPQRVEAVLLFNPDALRSHQGGMAIRA
jgi:hypothetical protein